MVRRISAALSPHGPRTWLDERELLPGDSLFGRIESAISDSDCVLAFITQSSVDSSWVRDELNAFLALEKGRSRPLVIPVILDSTPPPPFLAHRLQIRASGKSLGTVVQELLQGILRSHAILRLTPNTTAVRLEPFTSELDLFGSVARQGDLRTVYDCYELADLLSKLLESASDDSADDVRAAVPRVIHILSSFSPRLIQFVLGQFGRYAGAAARAERFLQVVWRLVAMTLFDKVLLCLRRIPAAPESRFDLSSVVAEWDDIRTKSEPDRLGLGVLAAVWVRHLKLSCDDVEPYSFIGHRERHPARILDATHILFPHSIIGRRPTGIPASDFMPYEWVTSVLPHIVANAVVSLGFQDLPIPEVLPKIGLDPADYSRYDVA